MVYTSFESNQLPNIDPTMERLGNYLKDGLNQEILKVSSGAEIIAVAHVISYNHLPTDLSSFPLLKVYRQNDSFSGGHNTTQASINYCLSFPDEAKIPGILRWVAITIDKLLREWGLNRRGCYPSIDPDATWKAEYRTMVLNGEPMYSLLMINFEFTEGSSHG
jgi:hypothetical protein